MTSSHRPSAPSRRRAGREQEAEGRRYGPTWLREHLRALLPGFPDVSLCVALSGGVDSVALLGALARGGRASARLRAVHVHHGLQPNADRWSAHCRALCERLRVPIKVLRAEIRPPRGASLEALAREARYELLAGEIGPGEVLLTAHHEDDQLETVLLQLLRGAGVAGLSAMPQRAAFAAGWLARPLLSQSRSALQAWASAEGLAWVEDESNRDERFDRNYLRLRVLPVIRARWPAAATTVSRSARHIAEARGILDAIALADVERAADGPALLVSRLRALEPSRRRNALRFWIARSGSPLPDSRRLAEIAGPVLRARSDAHPVVRWGTTVVRRDGDRLSLETSREAPPQLELSWCWREEPELRLPGDLGTLRVRGDAHGPLDLALLPPTLTIRLRRGGERMRRGGRTRTLKSILQSLRVPAHERARMPLVFAGEKLLAAGDRCFDESIAASESTHRRGALEWQRRGPVTVK